MKKFLSLVLALVMTMSLVTISAGAKDFDDNGDIDYKEAVDVISALGIVDGYSDGSFRPDGSLTRGAAAKIICNLILGPTTASALSATTAPFKDVPTTNVFAGYITYCAQQGIISGYGDGTFRPTGSLTGNAFLKMLLGALGYDSSIEGYTGSNWQVNVTKQAVGIGLNKGNDEFVGSKTVTRQEACLYAFNMLQADMVQYDSKTTVDINGATVTIAGDKAKAVSTANGWVGTNDGNIDRDGVQQFAEKYFDKLTLKDDGSDSFSRPSNVWRFKGEKIGTYAKTPNVTYSKNVELGDIYKDLDLSEKDTADVYINGVPGDDVVVSKANEVKIASDSGNKDKVGTGSTVEVFYDEDHNDVTICVIDNYVGTVSKTVEAKGNADRYVVIANESDTSIPSYNNEYETEETFADDAVVIFTYSASENEIQSVAVAESAAGAMTRKEDNKTTGKKVTLADTAYSVAKNVGYDGFTFDSMTVDSEYTAYLDQYGNAIYFVEEEFVPEDYALITAIEGNKNDSNFDSNRVKLLTGAGEIKTYDTDKDYKNANGKFDAGDIVTYKVDEDKEVKLSKTSTSGQTFGLGYFKDDGDFIMENGKAAIQVNGTKNAVYANSKTVFVIYDGDDYKVYTGINNAPTIMSDDGSRQGTVGFTGYCKTNGMLTIAFIDASDAKTFYNSKTVVFLAGDSKSDRVTTSDGTYYEYNAVVDGKIVDGVIKIDENANYGVGVNDSGRTHSKTNYMFNGVNFDKYDIGTSFNSFATGDTAVYTGTVKLSGDYTIGFGQNDKNPDVRYTVAEDAKIFYVNDDGEISEATLNSIKTDSDDTAMMVLEDGQITYLFVQEVTEGVNDIPVDNKKGNVTTELNGSKADATYTVASNGNLRVSVDYTAPDFATDTAKVFFDLEVYANGKYYDTISGLSKQMRNGEATLIETDGGYPTDEALTFKIINEKFDDVDLIIKDENGKVFTALDNATSKSAKDGTLTIAVSSTAYTGSFDVTDIEGATTTTSPLPTSVSVGSTGTTLAGVDIDGTKAVTVTIKTTSLNAKAPEYKITLPEPAKLSAYSVTAAGDEELELSFSFKSGTGTGLADGSAVTIQAKLSGNATTNYSYTITVPGNEPVVLSTTAQDVATVIIDGADVTLSGITISETKKMTVDTITWKGSTVRVTFTEAVDTTTGTAVSNYLADNTYVTAANVKASIDPDDAKTVILTVSDETFAADDQIVVKNVAMKDVAGNAVDGTTGVTYKLTADGNAEKQ